MLSPHGNINIGLFRITSKTGESVLVKVQPQHHFTSNVEQLEMVRRLGHRTPEYYVEFDFPKFNVQVLRTMKLPNMEQLEKRNPTEYESVKEQFDKEVEKLALQ